MNQGIARAILSRRVVNVIASRVQKVFEDGNPQLPSRLLQWGDDIATQLITVWCATSLLPHRRPLAVSSPLLVSKNMPTSKMALPSILLIALR